MIQARIPLPALDPADRVELEHRLVAFDLNWHSGTLRAAIGRIHDPEDCGKGAALDALRELAPTRVKEALEQAKKSTNKPVRDWATRELAKPSQ